MKKIEGKWQKFVEQARKQLGIKKARQYEPILLDYTDAELAVLKDGGKIERAPKPVKK